MRPRDGTAIDGYLGTYLSLMKLLMATTRFGSRGICDLPLAKRPVATGLKVTQRMYCSAFQDLGR